MDKPSTLVSTESCPLERYLVGLTSIGILGIYSSMNQGGIINYNLLNIAVSWYNSIQTGYPVVLQ